VQQNRMLRRALRAHEHGEFDKAERLYTAVLHIHSDPTALPKIQGQPAGQ